MAKVMVEVPNGKLCRGCEFDDGHTVVCHLFDMLREENEDNTTCYKCEQCPKE